MPKVLVISDSYPPHTVGGAELSLQRVLQALGGAFEITIAALSPNHPEPKSEKAGGSEIHWIPWARHWLPPLDPEPEIHDQGLARRVRHGRKALRYLFGPGTSSFGARWRRLQDGARLERSAYSRLRPTLDGDAVAMSRALALLKNLAAKVQPDLLHADNFRSILLAAKIGRPFVAFVRDHRFFCAHRFQAMHVSGQACTQCAFGCVAHTPGAIRDALVRLMRENLETRRAALLASSLVITASKFLHEYLKDLVSAERLRVVPNPHDDAAFVDAVQQELVPAAVPEVLCVGVLSEGKNPQLLVRCLPELVKGLGEVKLVFAGRGDPEQIAELRKLAAGAGQADRLEFTGFLDREALYRRYAQARVVACPTVWPEPFGRVPLEAGLSRRPVVASDLGGFRETILHEKTGLLVLPNDTDALAAAIVRLVKDGETAKRMGEAARAHIQERFSLEGAARTLQAAWHEAAQPAAAGARA